MVILMSRFDDIIKMQQRILEMYNPILQSVSRDAIIAANNALKKPLVNISELQISHVMQESLANFTNIIQPAMKYDYSGIVNISESVQAIIKSIQPNIEMLNTIKTTSLQNYINMISELNSRGYNLSEFVQQACDEIDDEEFIEEDFSSNEEIAEALQEQADDPKGFQERVADWSEAKKKKYYIIIKILSLILTIVFEPYIQETIGKPVAAYTISKVKELPKAAGKVIDELKKDFQAIITEDVPYYYKVTYTDENGDTREGYVAKKNLKIIEDEEAADKDMEDEE